MPVVDRVASGVGTALTPIVLDHREVLRVDEPPARLAGPPDPRDRGTVTGDLTALLWGGAARIFLMHHPTFSINSLCHLFGKQDYDRADESRNLGWLAMPTWGEAWHNAYHAFPTSSRHGADGRQIDLSAQFIELMEKLGIACDVVRVGPARRARKTLKAVS
jgi:stearoyl-CoA desaturase (Delta-9 desaturase)